MKPGTSSKMKIGILLPLSFISLLAFSQTQQSKQKRVALVIGAQTYTVLPPLRNAVNDAKAMATTLQAKGFQVDAIYNPKTQKDLRDAITRYYNAMKDQIDAVGIIFYAGHGMQLDGNNYLIPTTASLQMPADLDDQCIKMNTVMTVLKSTSTSLNILLLDACRTLPSFSRDAEQGWSRVDAPRGSIIVFATEAGKTASDGTGKNGLFTSKLLKVINEPGLNITDALKRVKRDVFIESNEKQLPSVEDNSIGGDFYFTPVAQATQSNTSQTTMGNDPKPIEPKKESVSVTAATNSGNIPGDGQFVPIGKQLWANKNLNAEQFANGEAIPEAKTAEDWTTAGEKKQPVWSYYENKTTNGTTYGKLYNWFAVTDARKLCPSGSHVATDKDWANLITAVGKSPANQIKSAEWGEGKGTDHFHFTATAGGMRFGTGKFGSLDIEGYWWTATEASSSYATGIFIGSVSDAISKRSYKKENGFAVRCVKD